MNASRIGQSMLVAICIALSLSVSACQFLSPTHSGRSATNSAETLDDERTHLNEEKFRHFTLWRSAELTGICDGNSYISGQVAVTDSIFIEKDGTYNTDRNDLSSLGKLRIDQLIRRIGQYDNIAKVEFFNSQPVQRTLESYPDDVRIASNSFFYYASLQLDNAIHLSTVNAYPPHDLDAFPPEISGASDGKIIVRVVAESADENSSSITLCAANLKGAHAPSLHNLNRMPDFLDSIEDSVFNGPMMLSVGDRVRLRIPEDTDIEGIYEIDATGNLDLPYVGSVQAVGLTVKALESNVAKALVDGAIIRRRFAMVDISVLQWSVADVFVSGAVFNPGRKTVNGLSIELKTFKQTQGSGDAARERYLSNALIAAGGVRPDADIANIIIRRQGETIKVDLEGILSGSPVDDVPLITGDEIYVPTTGKLRPELVTVSQITPQGLRLFVSNLITPRIPNQVDSDATKLPYGTRLLHALLSANCVGGTQLTNSAKKALLITIDPVTQTAEAVERDIQQLVNNPDSYLVNPFLMPNDGVACYDSDVTNYRDLARAFTDLLTPFGLLKVLIGN